MAHGVRICEVGLHERRLGSNLGERGDYLPAGVGVAPVHNDIRPETPKGQSSGTADAVCGTGDEGRLIRTINSLDVGKNFGACAHWGGNSWENTECDRRLADQAETEPFGTTTTDCV
jgi:hypothetical protein